MIWPWFGWSIARFDKRHQIESNWPTEVNFQLLKSIKGSNRINLFLEFKNILTEWETYLIRIFTNHPDPVFTPRMKNSGVFNFTRVCERLRYEELKFEKNGNFIQKIDNITSFWPISRLWASSVISKLCWFISNLENLVETLIDSLLTGTSVEITFFGLIFYRSRLRGWVILSSMQNLQKKRWLTLCNSIFH